MKTQMNVRNNAVSGVNRANNNLNNTTQNLAQNVNLVAGVSSAGQPTSAQNQFDKTFIKVIYSDWIDFIDFDGNLKEMPNLNNKDYAIHFLTPATNYAVLKIEIDQNSNEKRYLPLINDSKLNTNMQKTLTNLNTGKNSGIKDKSRFTRERPRPPQISNSAVPQQLNSNLTPTSTTSSQSLAQTLNSGRKNSRK